MHLMELTENICKNFEDYAQAKEKKTGKPTIIRLTTPDGNMNPLFGSVDIVPDENLNTRLKFHVSCIHTCIIFLVGFLLRIYHFIFCTNVAESLGMILCVFAI